MKKIDCKRKLSSRKFWAFVAAFAVSCVLLFAGSPAIAEKVSGSILALGSVVGYLLAESNVDKAMKNDVDKDKENE